MNKQVGETVSVTLRITNKTSLQQCIHCEMEAYPDNVVLVSGMKVGKVHLSPRSSEDIVYNVVFLKSGKGKVPGIRLVSLRHGSFLVEESNVLSVFVYP